MANEWQRAPRAFIVPACLVCSAGALALILSIARFPVQLSPQLALILAGVLVSENFALALPAYSVSLSYPLTISASMIGGPAAAGIAAAVSFTNISELRARRPVTVLLFNFGQLTLAATAGAWIYVSLGGPILANASGQVIPASPVVFPEALVPMLAASVVCSLLNLALTSMAVSILRADSPGSVLRVAMGFAPTQIALAMVGYLLAQLTAASPVAFVLFIVPMLVARQAYQRYAELRAAYPDSIRALVSALEAKDAYTRGHSERVSNYAASLGSGLGLAEGDILTLRAAGLLHDLGKLAIPSALLTKRDTLTEAEWAVVAGHAEHGAELVARIPVLVDLAGIVGAHHERYAGGGYPQGLAGEQIPLLARVLAVADAYDAMTSDRAYRPALSHAEAVARLVDQAGDQFDPSVVRLFIEGRIGRPAMDAETTRPFVAEREAGTVNVVG